MALLYSAYFFFTPAYRHSFAVWMEFAAFYAAFLILYFLVGELTGRRQTVAFVLFFLLVFLYYPLNQRSLRNVRLPFRDALPFLTRLRTLFLVLIAMMAGVVAETRYLGRPFVTAENILLLLRRSLGSSNFAFAQQARTNALLERANSEIERLSQEAERERIARDLHDLLGHTLTVITVKLDLARRLLSRDSDTRPERDRGSGADCSECPRRGEGSRVRLPRRRTCTQRSVAPGEACFPPMSN